MRSSSTLLIAAVALFALAYAESENSASGDVEKRKSAYMRFGRSDPDMVDMEKRKSAYMRFGKRAVVPVLEEISGPEEEEDNIHFNKRKSAYMRFGKRSAADADFDVEKRKSAYMRFGR